MGANFCGLRNTATPNRSPKQNAVKENCGGTAAVMKFMNPKSLLAAMKIRKTQSHRQEKQELQVPKNTCQVLTLEDLITTSPGFNMTNYTNVNGSEYLHVSKQSSKKIHPSFDGDCKEEFLPTNFSVEMSMKTEEAGNRQLENSSFCRTKSGKLKKKVSFRSPEVADIFVLGSPVIYVGV